MKPDTIQVLCVKHEICEGDSHYGHITEFSVTGCDDPDSDISGRIILSSDKFHFEIGKSYHFSLLSDEGIGK